MRNLILMLDAIRHRPLLLTGLSAIIGAATILSDPIFRGPAICVALGGPPAAG